MWISCLLSPLLLSFPRFPSKAAFLPPHHPTPTHKHKQQDIYPVTSMLGQAIFLLCIVLAHRVVLRDLLEAARITEFLRRQKVRADYF